MRCFNCGCHLTQHPYCTNCGMDVNNYKLVISASNIYYNDGLERAGVRDLTGAIVSLRQCLKLNKNHVDARNLLGLVYYEMGEGVQALNEWVISKNLRSKKNLASEYLNIIQSNPGKLEAMNAAIKKFNQALTYCRQDSLDLAVIQLKKVLSMNPGYVQAHLLLALLYIRLEEWGRAAKELERVLKVDHNNIRARRFGQILENAGVEIEHASKKKVKNKAVKQQTEKKSNISEDSYQYQSGNETIIQPMNYSDKRGMSSIWNILIGIAVGVAAAWFLILPASIQNEKAGINDQLRKVSEQLDIKTATINELESRIKTLEKEASGLHGQLEEIVGSGGTLEDMESLLTATTLYMQNPDDIEEITGYLEKISVESLGEGASPSFKNLYDFLLMNVGEEMATGFYDEGMKAYQNGDFETAIIHLKKAVTYDTDNQDAYFNLGNSYRKMEMYEDAALIYEKIIELFPGTTIANRSQSYINEINEQQSQ